MSKYMHNKHQKNDRKRKREERARNGALKKTRMSDAERQRARRERLKVEASRHQDTITTMPPKKRPNLGKSASAIESLRLKLRRALETQEERSQRLEDQAERQAARRRRETDDQRRIRLEVQAKRQADQRQRTTEDQKRIRHADQFAQRETEHEHNTRLLLQVQSSEQEAEKSCNCKEHVCDLELRICHMEQLLERVLGQLEAEKSCPAQLTPNCSAVETVVMGQPGMAPPVPLHKAAEHGDAVALVRALVHGADSNALDQSGDTALHCASRSGETLCVELLLASGASLDTQDACGASPLSVAVCCGHLSTVEILLEEGAQVEQADKDGRTPLMRAVVLLSTHMVSLLLKHGASVNVVDRNGESPLVTAARDCLMDILMLLICHSTPFMAQMVQAMNVAGSSDAFMILIKAVPMAATCSVKRSPLARVAREGWLHPVRTILSNCVKRRCQRDFHDRNIKHAMVGAKTDYILHVLWRSAPYTTRRIAMSRAAAMGWTTVLKDIVCHWKNRKTNPNDFSEIEDALQKVSTAEAAWELVQAHSHIAHTFVGRVTATRAAERGWYKILKALINSGVPVDSKWNGSPLLHSAASRGNTECVQMLMSRGASLQERDDDGWTPLHCAAEAGHSYVVDVLLKQGADSTAKDPFGLTPYQVATTGYIISLLKPVQ